MWEFMPSFCRFNSPKLSEAFAALLRFLEPMVNKNHMGQRQTALLTFSTMINHCRVTKPVTDQVKKTRLGLQRICMDYISGLSKLYCSPQQQDPYLNMAQQEKEQVLTTLKDFSSIAKSVKLSNLFLASFGELVASMQG